MIGYNYGAGESERVRKIYRVTLGMCLIIMAAGTVICLVAPSPLIALFTDNPNTIQAGGGAPSHHQRRFYRIRCLCHIIRGFRRSGERFSSLIISLMRYVIVILPAAWILSRLFGPTGVWNAFWITEAATAAVSAVIWFFVFFRLKGR